MKTEAMLFVTDVEGSSAWYQSLLGARSGHGGAEYEMIVDDEGELLFQFHRLDGEEHGVSLADAEVPRGAGVLLYVNVPDVIATYRKAREMGAVIEAEPSFQRLAGHTEFVLRDPDGYLLAPYTRGDHTKSL